MEAEVPLLADEAPNQEQLYGTAARPKQPPDQIDWKRHHLRAKAMNRNRVLLVKAILLAALLVATIFLVRFVLRLASSQLGARHQPPSHAAHLRLVSIFNRHGDRAPSDALPRGDKHRGSEHLFWPNGLHNLTEDGKMRLFKVGAETRRQYQGHLDYHSASILAFSSHIYRCRQSMEFFLRGLYDLETTMAQNRRLLADYRSCARATNSSSCPQVGPGSGSSQEWARVRVDQDSVPTLSFTKLNRCAYRLANPSQVDANWLNSPSIARLDPRGLEMVKQVLGLRYNLPMGFDGQHVFSTVLAELSLTRTRDTLNLTDHFSDWIDLEVSRRGHSPISLLDFYEQVLVFAQRDRISGTANLIQSGSLITSLVQSQQVALGRQPELASDPGQLIQQFGAKKLVVYSTHDTILQLLLFSLGIIKAEGSFEDRFHRWQANPHELGMFRDGLKMSQYGLSVRFELWELNSTEAPASLPVVRLAMYNRADSKHQPVAYEPVELGSICRQRHREQYPAAGDDDLERDFYLDGQYNIDRRTDCPFELFRNITADMMIGDEQLEQLCDAQGDKQLLHNN